MPLTVTSIRSAKPSGKAYKLADEKGLFLLIQPTGGKLWRWKYRVDGCDGSGQPKRIEKKLALGAFPDVSLQSARERRDEARTLLASGVDPSEQRKRDRATSQISATSSFRSVAAACIDKMKREGRAEATIKKREWFARLVDKELGSLPISSIEPRQILAAVRPFEAAHNEEKAHRTLQFIGQVFRYAVANQLAPRDPTVDLRGALVARKPKHLAAILDPASAGELMRALEAYNGYGVTSIALRLSPYVFVRPGELRRAEWAELDLEASIWRIAAAKMKGRVEHVVPLSAQAKVLFREAEALRGSSAYIFPSIRSSARPMSENTINAALRRLGYRKDEMTAHGFRAMASTLLNESGKWSPDAIERSLAHKDSDTIRAAYHRGTHWEERVQMSQWWADYLDQLRSKSAAA